jgi:hypothetical protein
MKTILTAAIVAAGIFSFAQSQAQTTHKDSSIGHKVGTTAKKVGHKTSNIAANTEAMITDKKFEGKCGPQGQNVYINKYSHYYYVNSRGHKVYLKKSELMDKPMK